jgi:predicted ATPase
LGWGQCIEHYGAGEAYMPVFEAFGRLCRGAEGDEVIQVLQRYAPSWLAQMPAVLSPAEHDHLQPQGRGATHDRMLREMAEALEALTSAHPLVLVLEDVHWSDASTLELLAVLARRREPARLLLLATYRPMELQTETHPLKSVVQELRAHTLCTELALPALSEEAVESYLVARLPTLPAARGENDRKKPEPCAAPAAELVGALYTHTEGHPLFLVSLVDDLLTQGALVRNGGGWALHGEGATLGISESMRQLVARQRERLPAEEQHVLEAASIVGMEFSAAAVAAALTTDTVAVEQRCEHLAARQYFLRRVGIAEWPDGTSAARYRFRHALHQELWRERVCPTQFQQFHRAVGERKERAYGERAREIAVELAVHFEQGREPGRAVSYLRQAAYTALQRSAHQDANLLLTKGLALYNTLPDTQRQLSQELSLRMALAKSLMATKGYASPEVQEIFTDALTLCQQMGETPQIFSVLFGFWLIAIMHADVQTARRLAEQLFGATQDWQDPTQLLAVHHALSYTLLCMGENAQAHEHAMRGTALYEQQSAKGPVSLQAQDPGITCSVYAAHELWMLGHPNQASEKCTHTLARAEELAHPYSQAVALGWACWLQQLRRTPPTVRKHAEALLALSEKHGFALWRGQATAMLGWALAMEGQGETGVRQIRQGLQAMQDTRTVLMRPYFLALLAEAHQKGRQIREACRVLDEALAVAQRTGEQWYEAELYRLKGELLLQAARARRNGKSVQHWTHSVEAPRSL